MNEYGKKMIASGIPVVVVLGACDFVKEAFGNSLDVLVGQEKEDLENAMNVAMAAYVAGARRFGEIVIGMDKGQRASG